jgi:integrase
VPKTHLTDLSVKALAPPPSGQVDYWDMSMPGFGLRVSQGGSKTFMVMHGERRKRVKIGRYPQISLANARTEAKLILAEATLHKGIVSITFEVALERFLATHCKKNNKASTAKETERLLRRHFLPRLARRQLGDIETPQIATIIDGLMETPSECNHAFTAVRTFFGWACRRQYLKHNPCASLQKPAKTSSRSRVLSSKELKAVWYAVEKLGAYGAIVRLLILTGQRLGEISSLRGSYIDTKQKLITLPKELTKNGRDHTFPYGAMVAKIIEDNLRANSLLFTTLGDPETAFNNWSNSKHALDRLCKFPSWTLHDLRRTFATNLAALGVPLQVVEKLLNHASGSISGVAAIYNRHAYADEMRKAIEGWEKHLSSLLKRRVSKD